MSFSVDALQQRLKHQHPKCTPESMPYLTSMPAVEGVLKLDTIRWRRRLKACSISFDSDAGSIRQKDPLPGSSCDLGTFTKNRFSERLCRMEFCKHQASTVEMLKSVLKTKNSFRLSFSCCSVYQILICYIQP